jgi:hypothetical protein
MCKDILKIKDDSFVLHVKKSMKINLIYIYIYINLLITCNTWRHLGLSQRKVKRDQFAQVVKNGPVLNKSAPKT